MTTAQTAHTVAKPIIPRRMVFDMTQLQDKYFFRGNPILSTLMYALSASFPDGERFFMDSVRHYQKKIDDPVLAAQIRGFIGQEAHHSHIHEEFNERAGSLGLVMDRVQRRFKKRLDTARRWSAPEFKRYLKTGFHPNDIDQSHLIERWQESYPEVAALQVG